ncbi:plasmid maintenance protein [Borrelia turicatae]|uniref:plasmid maintenance protein n=1 Tax=Borrelia turicatae TaxID=142 RepID=UPI00248B9DB8|nr:plasmid maintenance protein [Borrelia turicatae]
MDLKKLLKLKTLQKYLYKLEKVLGVTINYHKHLGVNMGTEVHYKLKYSKKECHHIINKHFRDKKEEKYQKPCQCAYIKKRCNKNEQCRKTRRVYIINIIIIKKKIKTTQNL